MTPLPGGRAHLSPQERRAAARIQQLLLQPGVLHGSLRVNRRRCGKTTCKCARGELHSSLVLSYVQDGKQLSIHVPDSWEERVRQWIGRDQEIRQLLTQLSDVYCEQLRNRKE
jgi:hypothetical protein